METIEVPFIDFHDRVAEHFQREFGRPLLAAGYPVRLLFFEGESLVGWHFGRPIAPDTYEMANSCVLPEHRRRGIYTAFTAALAARLRLQGVRKIVSRHRPENLPVLDAKRKIGFAPAGEVEDHRFGRLLCLEFRL